METCLADDIGYDELQHLVRALEGSGFRQCDLEAPDTYKEKLFEVGVAFRRKQGAIVSESSPDVRFAGIVVRPLLGVCDHFIIADCWWGKNLWIVHRGPTVSAPGPGGETPEEINQKMEARYASTSRVGVLPQEKLLSLIMQDFDL